MARQWHGVFSINRTWSGIVGVFTPYVPPVEGDYNGLLLALGWI